MTSALGRMHRTQARRELALAALVALTLAGCPLSDHYYIDDTLGRGGAAPSGGGTAGAFAATGGTDDTVHEGCVPSPEVCDGASKDCDAGACPPGCSAKQRNGHVYLLCLAPSAAMGVNYAAANMRCGSAAGELGLTVHLKLSVVESADEEGFLKDWIANVAPVTSSVWLGANDSAKEGTWVWGDGPQAWPFFHSGPMGDGMPEPGKYADFAPGTPDGSAQSDEDCAAFDGSLDWQWNDERCSEPLAGYVCEQNP